MVGLEARERALVALSLAGVVGLAWVYLWRGAGMAMGEPASFALVFLMWVVMMAGMMLPSATPAALLYADLVRRNAARGAVLPSVWIFASGYLLVWTGFSLGAALLQAGLERAGLLTPMLASASAPLSAGLLIAAGAYQLTPLKRLCLEKCRNPLPFFVARWRPGRLVALRLGASHGAYCLGCCWALMLLLFAAGVMSLLWIAVLAALVLAEKLLPGARRTSRAAGFALIAAGGAVLALG